MQQSVENLADGLGINIGSYDRDAAKAILPDIEFRKTASCKDSPTIDTFAYSKPSVSSPLHDLALSTLIQAARDIANAQKAGKGSSNQSASIYAKDAMRWLKEVTNGRFSLEDCCSILYGDNVCPYAVSAAIIRNPFAVASLDMPTPPDGYISLIEEQENMLKQLRVKKASQTGSPMMDGIRSI